MNYWIIADTHFGHQKFVELCGRPKNFNDKIVKNIVNCVKKDDIFIHLGDICIGRDEHWNNLINSIVPCKKWLTIGNHDNKTISWYLNNGWDFVSQTFSIKLFGHNILFSHNPLEDNGYSINIHGHLHNNQHHADENGIRNRKQFLIALENTNYFPLNLKNIIENFNTQKSN